MDLYQYPGVYDAFHDWKTDDIDFIVSEAKKNKGPILELAAGTGRLGLPIASTGISYRGLELSQHYVDYGNKKLINLNDARLFQGDMCTYHSNEKFKFIFIGFNSLLHLQNDIDIKNCFNSTHNNLDDLGLFLIDIFMPDPDYLYRDPEIESEFHKFNHPEKGKCTAFEKGDYDPETSILHVTWRYEYEDSFQDDIFEFDMNILFPDQMDRYLEETNWSIIKKYGDYDRSTMRPDSPKQIYLCRKK